MFNFEFQRIVLLGALGLVLVMLWQSWAEFQRQHSAPAEVPAPDAATRAADLPPAEADDIPAAPASAANAAAVAARDAATPPAQLIEVTTDLVRAQIDPNGGDLVRVELLRHPVSVDQPQQPFVLLHRAAAADNANAELFIAQSGLIGNGEHYPNHRARYSPRAFEYALGARSSLEVPLDWTAPDGVLYQKIFRFRRDSYRVEIDFRVNNQTAQPWSGFAYGQLKQTRATARSSLGFFGHPSYHGAAVYTAAEKYEKIDYDDMQAADLKRVTDAGWVAMMQHYFVAAWLPQAGARHEFFSGAGGVETNPQYRIGYKTLRAVEIAPGARGEINTALYVGPKEQRHLRRQETEGLLLTVDYGWLTLVAAPLFWLLDKIHGVVHNWGWSIVLLTLLVKAIFYPLSAVSYKSMAKMKKVAPRMKTLKERYGDDRRKFQQEMMKLYKTEKVNPAGGCLPILVQIPVFIALYWVLLESVELRQADFIWWINDLSIPDPYFVLPLIMGASMFVQFKLNPAPMDPLQQKVMMIMPVGVTILFLWFPAGLVLYWVVNNLLSIAQQYYITRQYQ